MANNNDGYIQVVARLNETKSASIIRIQLNEIQKKLQLQLSNVTITQNGLKSLQASINSIQDSLKVNVSGVNIDQNKMVQQVQQVTSKINASIKSNLGTGGGTSGLTRAFDISDDVASKLKKRYTDVAVLASDLQSRFKSIGTVTTEVFSHENKIIDGFKATITNADGAVEKLTFHLKEIDGVAGRKKSQWELTGATFNDNNIKLQEQAIKAEEQAIKTAQREAKQLEANVLSGYKTLTHYVQMMNNLSQRQVFNKNASAENVVGWQGDISVQNEKFKELKATIDSGVVSPEVLSKIKELSSAINDVILKGHEMARELGQSTSNVNVEAELSNLKTLMNNLKASDVEVEKLKADYGELVGLFVQAEETGDFSKFLSQVATFKAKFAEAKSEVRATNAEIADLASMAKQLQSNKMTSFFSRNSGDVRVTGLKTEIEGLITEWDALNKKIDQTGKITPSLQTQLDNLRSRMEGATADANKLQASIKDYAESTKLAAQRNALDSRMANWLRNNTAASQEAKLKIMELKAQIQDADRQKMTNLTNEFRKVTAAEAEAGRTGKKFFEMAVEKIKKFTGWFSISMVVMRAVRYFKEMATTVRELDTALVDLRKTTTATNAQLEEFYYEANNIGKALGVTTKDVIEAASAWSRLGLI